MRLAVIGPRKWTDRKLMFKHLNAWHKQYGTDLHIVSGGCPNGADKIAEDWARQRGVPFTIHPARWRDENDVLDKGAGFARNTSIVADCDVLLAFWDFSSAGTADTLTKARWAQPAKDYYVVNPLGKVFKCGEVWGEEEPTETTFKVTQKRLTVERCRAHPNWVYLFGDNLVGKGKAGQAVIRDEPNALGVPTKKYPSMEDNAFFCDQEFEANRALIAQALAKIPVGSKVVVPHRIGCNLAQLPMRAPRTYAYLCERLGMDNPFA